jgi:hypothetical protein
MNGWKASTVLMALGIALMLASEELLKDPETRIYGIAAGAIGVGLVAASKYLDEQGYKLRAR